MECGISDSREVKLPLYSSNADLTVPNLVGLQHPALASLPTQLVCPFRAGVALTPLREKARWKGRDFIVACDLIRPIRTTALKPLGELGEADSARILGTFQRMLAEA
jgi:hypothetical protein